MKKKTVAVSEDGQTGPDFFFIEKKDVWEESKVKNDTPSAKFWDSRSKMIFRVQIIGIRLFNNNLSTHTAPQSRVLLQEMLNKPCERLRNLNPWIVLP